MAIAKVPQIGIAAIRPLVAALRGREAAALLAEVGLAGLALDDPNARLPLACLDALWDRAAAWLGDDDLGLHLAATIDVDSFGLLSYLATASATYGAGLARLLRYFRVLSDASRYDLAITGDTAIVTASQDVTSDAPVRQRVEFTIAVMFCYARHVLADDWQPRDVFFEHAAPQHLDGHRALFGCTPRFAAAASGFALPRALLDCPLRTGNPTLVVLLEQLAARLLADLPQATTVAGELRELLIRDGFDPALTLDAAAHRLHLSPRTLQRRLRSEGTSHQAVLDAARRHVATRMLAQPGVGLAEVAFAVGFSEPGALHRAFKRWTGMSPVRYRRALSPAAR